MLNIYQVPKEEIEKIEWTGDPQTYDQQLFQLGGDHDEFLVVNPAFIETGLHCTIDEVPPTPGIKCVVWKFCGNWIAKYFNKSWTAEMGYWAVPLYNQDDLVWERNPDIPSKIPFANDPSKIEMEKLEDLPFHLIWYLDPKYNSTPDKVWARKCSLKGFPVIGTKDMGYISPKVKIKYNPDLPKIDFDFNFMIPWYDLKYEHVWYLDERYNPTEDKIWAIKIKLLNGMAKPIKDMGYISPKVKIEYNPILPKIDFDFDFNFKIPWYELKYEHVWYLDDRYNPTEDKIWAIKIKLLDGLPKPSKDMGYVSPKIVFNPELPDLKYTITEKIPYYDLVYEHVWYLDERYNPTEDKVWAIKIKLLNGMAKPIKDMGYISPKVKIKYNPILPNIDFDFNFKIPWYELKYEHVWYVDDRYTPNKDKVWAIKIKLLDGMPKPTKVAGVIDCNLPDHLDVVFISYNELNAEDNWQKVLRKAPYAKRVSGVKGIVAAHKQAASIVTTDMFYVVDGDADLADYWDFKFQPNLYDRDCVHVWRSINPINDLKYGYGGVKLFPTKLVVSADPNNTDMTTSLSDKFKLMPKISNTTAFNSDEFSTWRSAFRECAKLAGKAVKRQTGRETEKRLDTWCNTGEDRPFGKYAIAGAIAGKKFGEENRGDDIALQKVNDYDWLKSKFDML